MTHSTAPASAAGAAWHRSHSGAPPHHQPIQCRAWTRRRAVFTAVSKSGSNQFHGALYEYFRNSILDAKNFFDPPVEPIPPLRRNQFGACKRSPVGESPILHDELRRVARIQRKHCALGDANASVRSGAIPSVRPFLNLYPLPTRSTIMATVRKFALWSITAPVRTTSRAS